MNNPLDENFPPHHHRPYWKRVHRDWKFWAVMLGMIALMIFYVMSDNFALRGRGQPSQQSMPSNVGP